MQLLNSIFVVLHVLGFWRPVECYHWKKWLYNCYTAIMLFLVYSLTLSQIIEIWKLIDDVGEFIHSSVILLSMMNGCAKITNICNKRSEIIMMIDMLLRKPCCPQYEEEKRIQKHFGHIIKRKFFMYGAITELAVVITILNSIFIDIPARKLAFVSYLPFRHDTEVSYFLIYTYQFVAMIIGSIINICYDILVAGCMIQTCAQLEILKYRMRQLYTIDGNCHQDDGILTAIMKKKNPIIKKKYISKCIEHHLQIFKFAESVNEIFTYTIFFQYSVSLIVICTSAYKLSNVPPYSAEFLAVTFYLMCMLIQLFIFCFHGSNVTHKSANICNDIYSMDWLSLDESTKKSLLIIMTRTVKPITFTSGHIVVLSLNSFTKLLELSYSVYSVIHNISH